MFAEMLYLQVQTALLSEDQQLDNCELFKTFKLCIILTHV